MVIAFGTLLFFLTQLYIVIGVVSFVYPFAGDEKLKTVMSIQHYWFEVLSLSSVWALPFTGTSGHLP